MFQRRLVVLDRWLPLLAAGKKGFEEGIPSIGQSRVKHQMLHDNQACIPIETSLQVAILVLRPVYQTNALLSPGVPCGLAIIRSHV